MKTPWLKMQGVATLILLTALSTASADIYRWVDAQGRVQYSDRPVPGSQRVGGSKATDPAEVAQRNEAANKERAKADEASQQQQTDAATAKNVQQDMAKIKAEQCKEAQETYKTATESQRLYRIGKNGEREYLTDEELTTTRLNARKALDAACGKAPG